MLALYGVSSMWDSLGDLVEYHLVDALVKNDN